MNAIMNLTSNCCRLPVLASAACAFGLFAGLLEAGDFKVGAAAVVITPPVGTPIAGSYTLRRSMGVLDDLHAKAIVVEQDGQKAALVAVDMAYTAKPTVAASRKLIAEQCGIPPERVMISATHTHSGPVQTRGNLMDAITGANQPDALAFTAKLPELVAKAVAEANAKLKPGQASAVVGQEDAVSFNRRYVMKDGTMGWMTARSPNMDHAAGPIDPDVGLCYFINTGKDARPVAAYVNFAMHPTVVGGAEFSADYPGRIAKRFAEYRGPNFLTLFANGCCGNVNQINPKWPGQTGGVAEAERLGTVLASAVLRAFPKLETLHTFAPRAKAAVLQLPRPTFTEAEIAAAKTMGAKISTVQASIPAKAKTVCILETIEHQQEPLEAEVQVVALSEELAIVALPGEMFVELGLAVKRASPFKYTFIAELANGSIGYIPNRSAYPEGLYEVVSARCAAGSGEILVDAAIKMLKELHAQP